MRFKPSLIPIALCIRATSPCARDNGVVTLGGYVWTTQEIQQARQDAQRAQGVTKVVNRIQVDRGAIQNAPSAH